MEIIALDEESLTEPDVSECLIPSAPKPTKKTRKPLSTHSKPATTLATTIEKKPSVSVTELKAGTFDVILVVDTREAQSHKDNAAILSTFLLAQQIPFLFRTLPIGDFAWICKSRLYGKFPLTLSLSFLLSYLCSIYFLVLR
jgi:hypothetical protein